LAKIFVKYFYYHVSTLMKFESNYTFAYFYYSDIVQTHAVILMLYFAV
jgi:hypothetical protein